MGAYMEWLQVAGCKLGAGAFESSNQCALIDRLAIEFEGSRLNSKRRALKIGDDVICRPGPRPGPQRGLLSIARHGRVAHRTPAGSPIDSTARAGRASDPSGISYR